MDWSNLREDYERLGTFKAVAEEYGTWPETVQLAARRLGIKSNYRREADWDSLTAEYEDGASVPELAEQYGCSKSLVYQKLREAGVQMRTSGPRGWKWTGEQHAKRRAAVERGAYKGNHREHFSRLGKQTPKQNSPQEKLFHQALIKARLSFETQSRELRRYWPDIKLHQQPVLVEIDSWGHDMASRREHDERRDAALTDAGYIVVRFTNEQVEADAGGCVRQLIERFGLQPEENPVAIIRDRRSYD